MKIVCLIKQVPRPDSIEFDQETKTLRREGVPLVLNPFDGAAVVHAAALRGRNGGGEVIAMTMGPPQAEAALRTCLALGADPRPRRPRRDPGAGRRPLRVSRGSDTAPAGASGGTPHRSIGVGEAGAPRGASRQELRLLGTRRARERPADPRVTGAAREGTR